MFLILGLSLFIMMKGVCLGTVSPKYLVVKVSGSARFNCTTDAGATYIQWYFGLGAQPSLICSEHCELYLDVNDAQLSNAGLYQCVWTRPDGKVNQSSALLVVLEQDPVFSSNASHDEVVDGDIIMLTCSVSLRDYLIYNIAILDTFGTSVTYSIGTLFTSDSTVHNISVEYTVPANSTTHENFACLIEFFDVIDDSLDKGPLFYSRTLYTSLNVTYPVRNVHPNAPTVVVNGTIECQSDAFPPAFKYEWKYLGPTQHPTNQALENSTDIDVFKTTERFLTLFTPGKFNFKCTAFNLVKNISYNSTWTGVISVSSGKETNTDVPTPYSFEEPAVLAGIIGGSIGGFLLIVIIVILIACKRRRRPAESPTGSLHQQIISPPKSPLSDDDLTVVDNDLYSAFCDQKAKVNGTSSAQKQPGNDYMSRNFDTTIVDNVIYDSSPPPCTATNASNFEDGQDAGYASVEEMKGFHSTLQSKDSPC